MIMSSGISAHIKIESATGRQVSHNEIRTVSHEAKIGNGRRKPLEE